MRLNHLVAALPALPAGRIAGDVLQAVEIDSIVDDSRQVQPGALFVAYRGVAADGHDFVGQAIEAGAAAVVGERDPESLKGWKRGGHVPYVRVPNGREALAYLSAAWNGFPARHLKMIGVTGTDGKTTVSHLIHAVLTADGRKAGLISTVSAHIGEQSYDTGLHTTTPDAPEVQSHLARMVAAGSEYAVLESTSHGLAQRRVAACDFDLAVVTNITHEHLDFHGTHEAYVEAKAMLFQDLSRGVRKPGVAKIAVLNADDSSFQRLRTIPADLQITYGLGESADVRATDIRHGPSATRFLVDAVLSDGSATRRHEFELETALIGEFNVYNCLAAVAATLSQGIAVDAVQRGIAALQGVVGRMERIGAGQDFLAIVDFAHTPRALEVALQTARRLTLGRVIVVFGCAGLRDVQKRAWMGRIAAQLADLVVITAEDPRTEPLHQINAEIARGCQQAGRLEGEGYLVVDDRRDAISTAVGRAMPGDLVIVTGKGHERSMCFGSTEYLWSDREALRAALDGRIPAGPGVESQGGLT